MIQSPPPIPLSSWAALSTTLIALLATGCDEQAAPPPRIEIDSAGVRIVTIDPLASDAMCSLGEEPTFYVGDSEDSDEQWFTRVLGVARLSDGSVAVADDHSMEVRIFDQSGAHVRSISINVRNERSRPRDFSTPDKSHVEAHAPDGKLLGILATVRGRSFGEVDDGTLNYELGPWYDSSPSIDAEGRTIVIANGRDPEVRVLDDEMRLRLIIRWDDPGGKVTSADIDAAREAERRRALEDGEIGRFEEANLSPKRPAADVFPAVSSVKAGVDGTVWVWRYRRPGAAARSRLMAFGPDGEFVCHLATGKSDFTIWEFEADYVLGVHTTEFGVQHVAMYDLERPGSPPE